MIAVFLYWLTIHVYGTMVRIASVFNPKAKLFVRGRMGLLSQVRYALLNEKRQRIWMHCASLGEFEQGRPVLEQLKRTYPGHAIVLTFFSPSGYEVRKDYNGADYVFYLPVDTPYKARMFVKIVQPALAIFVKYELWYFLLMQLAQKDIPILLVSAIFRDDHVFFKWYGTLHRKMLNVFTHLFVQDEYSKHLLARIGVEQVIVSGDTRFDRVAQAVENLPGLPQAEAFCTDCHIIVAGSTWPEDERLLQKAFFQLPANWKMIVVPHEVGASHITELNALFADECTLWSDYDAGKRVLIVDRIGILLPLYRYAYVTYVGGGFTKSGIHNVLEAAVHGKPVFTGPNYQKFKEARELVATGVVTAVEDADAIVQRTLELMVNKNEYDKLCTAATKYISANTGATAAVSRYIEEKHLLTRL